MLLTGLISLVLGVPIGAYTAVKRGGVVDRALFVYSMLAGSIPDFWLGLILIFVFFSLLGWLPGPIGQLDPIIEPPPRITGMIALDAAHAAHELPHEGVRLEAGGEVAHPQQGVAEHVRDHDRRAVRVDVDGEREAPARLDVEVPGLPPALALALGAFEDEAGTHQLVDEQADRAPAQAHGARKVGAGDGLADPDEVEGDLAVDLAGRPPARDAEGVEVDATHAVADSTAHH